MQDVLNLLRLDWRAEIVALHEPAAAFLKHLKLFLRFNAFCYYEQIQVSGHCNDRIHDSRIHLFDLQALDKRLVNLQFIDGEILEIAQ